MRVLHARDADDEPRAAGREPGPDRARDPHGDLRRRLPLHGAILRGPYAHARINSIDTSAALAHPNVAAVITAKDLETLALAWMPTISYDAGAAVR